VRIADIPMMIKITLLITILTLSPLQAQTTLKYELRQKEVNIYFGKDFEAISHFSVPLLIGAWRPDYSLVAAVAIETADTFNGRFDAKDWGARLTGCFVGYLFNRYIFKK